MSAIQAIYVRGHETRQTPTPHTVYRIEVHGAVRSWQVWRRYSEFDDLNTELTKTTSAAPPVALPPKHSFSLSLRRKYNDDKLIEERSEGLEGYLRAILASKDDRWREALAFKEFLEVPVGKTGLPGGSREGTIQFTSSSWLDEQVSLQTIVRDIRADINKRDALSDRGDVSASHQSNVQAKQKLALLVSRVGVLNKGLETLALAGMSEGEVQRRTEIVARLRDDCEKLGKMVVSARQSNRPYASLRDAERNPASQADRAALIGAANGSRPIARVFGAGHAPPQETDETRPLDDNGLVQLQQTQMDNQDSQLTQLSTVLRRQRQIGVAIGSEIEQQNELLDQLTGDLDRVGAKMSAAKKQMNRLG
ncbi:hypothetical protein BOTBODRAFT_27272 [Botryobasidium botryosum FD-172 SS1]|uniref:t-SNARE coiled-coil homology domain-containing protein n=1 Tax=Botryobasidium botryosum (strain FD-172 SS1) TaxID=930990 RepID=A0A067MVV3_BOTB1|nr:hypothetical protein BOTBODRAFT_27272 [Botryobasidium botryosum FD-172 SS1]